MRGGVAVTALKRLRMQRGITQEQLAEAAGTSKRLVQRWENGKGRPSDKYLPLMAAALQCRVEDIWTPPIKKWLRGYDEERIRRAGSIAPVLRKRLELEMSQKELAAASGVGLKTIRDLEAGKHTATWETAQKLRRAVGLPEERFFSVKERNQKLLEMMNIVQWVMGEYASAIYRLSMDREDVFQELALCALRALDRYYPREGGASIETYVIRNLMGKMKHLINKQAAGGLVGGDAKYATVPMTISLEGLIEAGAQFAS